MKRSHLPVDRAALPVREEPSPALAKLIKRRGWTHGSRVVSVRRMLGELAAGVYAVPAWQRGFVWTDEQVMAFLTSLLSGFNVGTMLAWQRYDAQPGVSDFGPVRAETGSDTILVVDGRQRLTALAVAFHSGRFGFDVEAGQFTNDGTGLKLADLLHWRTMFDAGRLADVGVLVANLLGAYVSVVVLEHHWPLSDVLEQFTLLNRAGTPFDQDELARLVAVRA